MTPPSSDASTHHFAAELERILAASIRPRSTIDLCLLTDPGPPRWDDLERSLASARPHVHGWTVATAWPADVITELAHRVLDGLPGRVVPGVGADGTGLREAINPSDDDLADDREYALLLEAGHVVTGGPLPSLGADRYDLPHDDGDARCWATALVRRGRTWRLASPLGRELIGPPPIRVSRMHYLTVKGPLPGWSDPDRVDTPALTDPERAFWPTLVRGERALAVDFDAGMAELHRAVELAPDRAEPFHAIARAANAAGLHDLAVVLMRSRLDVPVPDARGPVRGWVYQWGMRVELAVGLLGLGRLPEAAAVVEAALAVRGLTPAAAAALLPVRQVIVDASAAAGSDDRSP